MSADSDAGTSVDTGVNRRSFLQSSGGVGTGLAVMVVPSAALALAAPAAAAVKSDGPGAVVHPEGEVPSEPVMAYVHDAVKGDVTVLSGTTQKTYRDPVLAQRLLEAARAQTA